MAYLPPHRRQSKESPRPTPVPSSFIPQFNQSLTLGSGAQSTSRRRQGRRSSNQDGNKIFYATNSVSRWFTAGSSGDDPIPASVRLESFDWEAFERENGENPLVIRAGEKGEVDEQPWMTIAKRVEPDLVKCYQSAIDGRQLEGEVVKLSFIARMGKVLFHGDAVDMELIRRAANSEADSRKQVKKSFYTNVPSDYMEKLEHLFVLEAGFGFVSEKEHYEVKVFDKSRLNSIISCKCTVANDGRALNIRKIELNSLRHLVVDISCLYKDLDLRLTLVTKCIMRTMDDVENEGITKLIQSAIIDPGVKGGLRWTLGEDSVADRFSVVGVGHIKYKAFKNDVMNIKLRHADRFDHKTSTGEVIEDVSMKLTGITKKFRDGNLKEGLAKEMLQEAVKFVWDHLLS